MRALTVRQPWATLIFYGKNIENRTKRRNYRGPLAIHASAGMTRKYFENALDFVSSFDDELSWHMTVAHYKEMQGCLLGIVDVVDCVDHSDSPWFTGPYGLVLANPRMLAEPIPYKGQLGLRAVKDAAIAAKLEDLSHA